jgi:chromate transporter
MALKDYGTTPEERSLMQIVGCIIGTVAIFLTIALLVLFFFPIWNNLKKYAAVYRSLEGINAVVVGILIASTFYLMKDISLLDVKVGSLINAIVIAVSFTILQYTRIPPPFIVVGCLLL